MAELFKENTEDDESSEEEKNSSRRVDPKKLAKLPIMPPPTSEKPATLEELKRTVEFFPPLLDEEVIKRPAETQDGGSEEYEETEADRRIHELSEKFAKLQYLSGEGAPGFETGEDSVATQPISSGGVVAPFPPASAALPRPLSTVAQSVQNDRPTRSSGESSTSTYVSSEKQSNTPGFSEAPSLPSPNLQPSISLEQHQSALTGERQKAEAEKKRSLKKALVAGFLTGYVVRDHLARLKRERYEKSALSKELNQRNEQISGLQLERQQLQRQLSHNQTQPQRFETPLVKPTTEAQFTPATVPEEQIFDLEGNEITLEPGWRVVRPPGGYLAVLDKHNRVVHNAVRYGEAFKRDQKREQLSPDLFNAVGSGKSLGGGSSDNSGPVMGQSQPVIRPARNDLPGLSHLADLSQRPAMPKPGKQLQSTVLSPWLWTAVAILIIIYFVAALA